MLITNANSAQIVRDQNKMHLLSGIDAKLKVFGEKCWHANVNALSSESSVTAEAHIDSKLYYPAIVHAIIKNFVHNCNCKVL